MISTTPLNVALNTTYTNGGQAVDNVDVHFYYDTNTPYEVNFVLDSKGAGVTWQISRDLLLDAHTDTQETLIPANVRAFTNEQDDTYHITLSNNQEGLTTTFTLPMGYVMTFLMQTLMLINHGEETLPDSVITDIEDYLKEQA